MKYILHIMVWSVNVSFGFLQVGVGKSILQTLLGFFMFGGVTFHPVNVLGHVMNIMGGVGYTFLKYALLIAITITLTLTQIITHVVHFRQREGSKAKSMEEVEEGGEVVNRRKS